MKSPVFWPTVDGRSPPTLIGASITTSVNYATFDERSNATQGHSDTKG